MICVRQSYYSVPARLMGHTTDEIAGQLDATGLKLAIVVSRFNSFFTQQLAGVTHNLVKCQKKLLDLEKSLAKWRQGKGRGNRAALQERRDFGGVLLGRRQVRSNELPLLVAFVTNIVCLCATVQSRASPDLD